MDKFLQLKRILHYAYFLDGKHLSWDDLVEYSDNDLKELYDQYEQRWINRDGKEKQKD